jgi:hypothetical protein
MLTKLREYRIAGLKLAHLALLIPLAGCAGLQRSCASGCAESFGRDWIVVQYRYDGTPLNCWRLPNTSITNESNSDGIYWLDPHGGHLVHISGWYNRVQVEGGSWADAGSVLGIDYSKCGDGAYHP